VLGALAGPLAETTNRQFSEKRLARLLYRHEQLKSFMPDFMAQLMEEQAGLDYFRVLESLDTETLNENHSLIAALAGSGVVRAVVTTNFDRLLERALDAAGTPSRVFATGTDFEELPVALDEAPERLLVRRTARSSTWSRWVDTLAQRVAGRPQALEDSITRLLERHACLVVGFSGADLAYHER
jgi:hypothetical protein